MSIFRATISAIVLLTLMTACASPANEPPQQETQVIPPSETTTSAAEQNNPLLNIEWALMRFGAPGQEAEPVANTRITATFTPEGVVNGSAGCNSYFANYTATANRLTLEQAGRTEMACAEPAMQQENVFLEAITAAESYAVAGDTLTIAYKGGQMFFRSIPKTDGVALFETPWQLTTFVEGDAASSTIAGTKVTLRLANGVARGTAGCNRYSGAYTTSEDKIAISQVISTKMACTATGVMEQETRFLNALGAAESWTIDGETLTLKYQGGELIFNVTQEE
ncbi:MAG: META domain-containing protein [Chloroflexi bacterium]|nr:META domain-containing protein [Chloroflexota bacterium]